MAQLHEKFSGIAGPTDVLTFQHGEILISVETAARQAPLYKTSLDEELRLYILHGLLHLCGYDDRTRSQRRTMQRIQSRLFKTAVLAARREGSPPTGSGKLTQSHTERAREELSAGNLRGRAFSRAGV